MYIDILDISVQMRLHLAPPFFPTATFLIFMIFKSSSTTLSFPYVIS